MITLYDLGDFCKMQNENKCFPSTILDACYHRKSDDLVSNVKTKMAAMMIEQDVWPLTINKKEYRNSVVCSPYTTYISYPLDELKKIKKNWVKLSVLLNTVLMGLICRITKLNKIVQINNNLNATLIHSPQFYSLLPEITDKIVNHYPKHAVVFIRVNNMLDIQLLETLKKNDYLVFHDRSSHVFFPENNFQNRTDTKKDFDLLKKSNYMLVHHEELLISDAKRLSELYQMLFIGKHSKSNPLYTEDYFKLAIQHHWHHYTALRNKEGRIDAFSSWVEKGNNMSCGPMGYDTTVDIKVGLYRQAVALYLMHAHEKQLIFNMGGGSDKFKLNRGSTKTLEYTAVYYKHLPFYRHVPWKIFHWAFNKFFKKIMQNEVF